MSSVSSLIKIKSYEHVVHVIRRHGVTFIPYILLFLILICIPVIAYYLFEAAFTNVLQGPQATPIVVLAGSTYYLALALFFYSFFVEFYLDCWILTNDRLVDVRQISLFARTIAEVDLYQIQDVSSEIKGFFPSIFNYGDVYLQTAGPVPKFILLNVPNPDGLRQQILDLASEDKKFHA
ncbi:MAG: PH domain-containing protein [Candidatus Magasanikbacteria bacterium]|nr:PH domain-containing protein [Candidatus Magasanikbacteria bacterium]